MCRVMTFIEQVASLRRNVHRLIVRRLAGRASRSLVQLTVLRTIDHGVRSQAAVAERLMLDAPAVSRAVDRLEADGLVRRLPGTDRRCVGLELTDAARAEFDLLGEAIAWLEGEVQRHLTPEEFAELLRLLGKVQLGLAGGDPNLRDEEPQHPPGAAPAVECPEPPPEGQPEPTPGTPGATDAESQ